MNAHGLRFAANLTMLFTDSPLIERFGRARAAGFNAVEVQFLADTPVGRVKAELAGAGCTGFVGGEHVPSGPTEQTLGWSKM